MDARQSYGDGRRVRPAVAAVAAAVVLSALPVAAGAAERVALVIGNGAYAHVKRLPNPGNDAADVGAAFERLGFTVTRVADADQATLRQRLRDFTRAAGAAEVAVVFYAGHGMEVDGRNFLVPVDAKLLSDQDVEFEAVPLELVMRSVERARGLRLVVLDACRDNPFTARMQSAGATRSIGRGLARVEPQGETLVAYAAKGGSVAADGDGRNSPYTGALLRYLEEPGVDVGRLFRKVRDDVLASTGGRQEPFVYGSLPGRDVYLASAAAPPPPPPPPKDGAKAALDTAKEVGTVAAYQSVVKHFPGTFEADMAQAQIDKLEGAKEPLVVVGGNTVDEAPAEVEKGLGLSLEQRRLVQMGLAAAGRDPGGADGLFGGKTRRALSAWQASKEVEATGYLTKEQGELLVALGREAEERRKRAQTPGYEFQDCPGCPELVVVPEGTYRMGSPESESGRDDDEGPVHRVRIGYRFAVGVKEVTRGEFARFVSTTGRSMGDSCWTYEGGEWKARSGRNWKSPGYSQTDEHPVVCVNWDDAKAYVRWLSGKTGKEYRLLSEAEWEYVARAGTTTPFHTGRTISTEQANYNGNYTYGSGRKGRYRERTAPVGSFEPNDFGLHDVHGNVWEWTEDCWNDSYRGAPSDGSAWESGNCSRRVVRGGSWNFRPLYLRSAVRNGNSTGYRINYFGFRVARTLTP